MKKVDYTHYYLKWHKNTKAHEQHIHSHYENLLGPYLPKDKSARIFDIGCGTGLALDFLRRSGFSRMEGIDTDEGQAKLAMENGLPVVYVKDPITHLKSRENSADIILCLDVLEHIPKVDQIEFLSAIFLSLKPGGYLIMTVPNANSSISPRWRYNDWTHETSFTEHSLDFVLFHAGFKNIQIKPAEFVRRPDLFFLPLAGGRHWWAFKFFRMFRRLEMMAELGPEQGRKIPLSLNLLAIAYKK